MKNILALSFLVLLTACSAAPTSTPANSEAAPAVTSNEAVVPGTEATVTNAAKSCTCVKIYMPVCGENKKTYGNSCEADCAGVKYTQGECKVKAKKK